MRLTARLLLLVALLSLFSSGASIEHYNVYIEQGTGDWSFITFYPLRLTIRPNDTVTFIQKHDIGLLCLPAPGVSTALNVDVPSDPVNAYLNQLSVPTDDPDIGLSVVSSATASYSAGFLYPPDIIDLKDPTGNLGLRSNWTFEFPIEGVFVFQELLQQMSITIYVTTLQSQQPLDAVTVEAAVAQQMQTDLNRLPSVTAQNIDALQVPTKDSEGRWVVYTGWLEASPPPSAVGFGVYNRFLPGPTLNIKVNDKVRFTSFGKHPHAVAFNGTGDEFIDIIPPVYDTTLNTYKQPAIYNSPSFPDANGDIIFDGERFMTLGILSQTGQGASVKFTKEGVYRYVCILHLNLGMEALIVVGPSSGAASSSSGAAPASLLASSAGMLVSAVLFILAM